MCNAQCSCFLHFIDFVHSRFVAQVFSECWYGSSCSDYYWYHFCFTLHMRCIASVRSSYFRIFLASLLVTFLSPQVATCISVHVPFSLSRITMSGLWLGLLLLLLLLLLRFYHLYAGYLQLYNEMNHVSRVCSVATVLYLEFLLHVMLHRPWESVCTFTLALSVLRVQYPIWLFCSSLISCFLGMLLRYCLSDLEMVPVAPIITGITFAFTFHMCWIPIIIIIIIIIIRPSCLTF